MLNYVKNRLKSERWACPDLLDKDFLWLFMGVKGLEVHRGEITQGAVEPFWVIERFDVIEDGQTSLVAVLEVLLMERFGFEGAPKRLHGSVVVAIALSTHAGTDMSGAKQGAEGGAGVLNSTIGMMEETRRRAAGAHGLVQGIFDQRALEGRTAGPTDDSSAVEVHDGRQIEPTLGSEDVSDVPNPNAIG
jgi:hypothetical protein